MKIGRLKTNAKKLFYDDCHKIYLIEDENDIKEFYSKGWSEKDIFSINDIVDIYENSCSLKFIQNCKLTKTFARQFQNQVTFVFDNGDKKVIKNNRWV